MPKEANSNVVMLCKQHAPKKNAEFTKIPLAQFVKVAFPAINPAHGTKTKEHMWVKVEKVERGALVGTLDNIPVFKCSAQYGDQVRVRRSAIEAVTSGEEN